MMPPCQLCTFWPIAHSVMDEEGQTVHVCKSCFMRIGFLKNQLAEQKRLEAEREALLAEQNKQWMEAAYAGKAAEVNR